MPTIPYREETVSGKEPGGNTCYKCRTDLESGEHAYREVFGKIDEPVEMGVTFTYTGGIVVRHFCMDCFNDHRDNERAAIYQVESADRLYMMLGASYGQLVADCLPMLVGGRLWIRCVGDDLQAMHVTDEMTENGIRSTVEPLADFTRGDFNDLFQDPGDQTRVYLRNVEDTPFDGGDEQ